MRKENMKITWKNEILNDNFRDKYSVIENSNIYMQLGHRDEHSVWNESEFAKRKDTEFTTSWCEHIFVEKEMQKILGNANIDSEWLCIDLGCSDGRFVKFLLGMGVKRVVAINFEILPLKLLENSLTADEREKVLLICGDFLTQPFSENTFDLAIAWGFWSATTDFNLARELTLDITKKEGYILNAEPILEQHIIYSLVRGDINEFLTTLKNRSRPVSWENKMERYEIKTENQIQSLMKSDRYILLDQFGVSSLYSLIFGGIMQEREWSNEEKLQIYRQVKDTAELFHENRQIAFFSKKVK